MTNRSILLLGLLIFLAPGRLHAQQDTPTGFPEYSQDQLWRRADFLSAGTMVFVLGQAKSRGHTVEDVANDMATFYASGWSGVETPRQMMGWVRVNYLASPQTEFEILEASEDMVRARMNRPWKIYFGESGEIFGVTFTEVEALFRIFYEEIAGQRGLVYEQEQDAEHVVITVRTQQ